MTISEALPLLPKYALNLYISQVGVDIAKDIVYDL